MPRPSEANLNALLGILRGNMSAYKDWELIDEMPCGWAVDKAAGSPVHGYAFVTNRKSVITGQQKRALLRVLQPQRQIAFDAQKAEERKPQKEAKENTPRPVIDAHYCRTVNELARQKFKQRLLNDILVDLTICEIEGWCKLEYISEIRKLINSLANAACIDA